MKIRIRSTSSVTDGLRGHIGRRLNSALARFRGHVDDVQVRNGPRGGVDKRCRLVLSASRGDVLVAEGRAPNFYQAVDLATNRAARSVRRVSAAPHTMRRSA
jgi:putative sigma-54 modulation protein